MEYLNKLISKVFFVVSIALLASCFLFAEPVKPASDIVKTENNVIQIQAGILSRQIRVGETGITTVDMRIDGQSILGIPFQETTFCLYKAFPNRRPRGIDSGYSQAVEQRATEQDKTDALNIKGSSYVKQSVEWTDSLLIGPSEWKRMFGRPVCIISNPSKEKTRLTVRCESTSNLYGDITVSIFYEIHEDFPGIKKWVSISNDSPQWVKIDQLSIDNLSLNKNFSILTDLTPSERGAVSSVRGFTNRDKSTGLIAASEVPSALRCIGEDGRMGYSGYFEWVLGPAESFVSEPVYIYAFNGESYPTISGVSTGLDRTVEGLFKKYLYEVVGLLSFDAGSLSPIWCSWSNFGALINDGNIREMANIASEAGMKTLLLDAGWSEAVNTKTFIPIGMSPDRGKFPDFQGTCNYITGSNLKVGLWVTCYRDPELSEDFKVLPDGYSLPKIKRDAGLGMSFASRWRYYYANSLIKLRDQYNATYFKQDLTNIKFGDIAEGHDSRTQKESILRGLRGLFETQDIIRNSSPDITMELTHELYWDTPGTPCDLAALKHAHTFHVPPNDYSGAGYTKQRVNPDWLKNPGFHPDKLQEQLVNGCWNARQKIFSYRGLPLQSVEYYGAATVNFNGSLTPQVQQRQLCSWLMGAPNVFAGDLVSLSEENRRVYREGFSLLERLNREYGIYQNFQYSGVPEPTDTDWHWWGKLDEDGYGAVVVIRGKEGEGQRRVNIPWVQEKEKYKVRLCFSGIELGVFTGHQLIDGNIILKLGKNSQEIIEISAQE